MQFEEHFNASDHNYYLFPAAKTQSKPGEFDPADFTLLSMELGGFKEVNKKYNLQPN